MNEIPQEPRAALVKAGEEMVVLTPDEARYLLDVHIMGMASVDMNIKVMSVAAAKLIKVRSDEKVWRSLDHKLDMLHDRVCDGNGCDRDMSTSKHPIWTPKGWLDKEENGEWRESN